MSDIQVVKVRMFERVHARTTYNQQLEDLVKDANHVLTALMTTTTSVPSCLPAGFACLADVTTLLAETLVDAREAAMAGFRSTYAMRCMTLCSKHY